MSDFEQVGLDGFDANAIEPASFDVLPAGAYTAVITNTEMKPTKAGTGTYLELEIQIIEGEYANRKLWDRLNLKNPNEKAVRMGLATLSSICRAVGIMTPKDSSALRDIPLVITVVQKKRQDTGEQTNEIKAYGTVGVPPCSPKIHRPTEVNTEDNDEVPW